MQTDVVVQCKGSHKLKSYCLIVKKQCNNCQTFIPRSIEFYGCRICKYIACEQCCEDYAVNRDTRDEK